MTLRFLLLFLQMPIVQPHSKQDQGTNDQKENRFGTHLPSHLRMVLSLPARACRAAAAFVLLMEAGIPAGFVATAKTQDVPTVAIFAGRGAASKEKDCRNGDQSSHEPQYIPSVQGIAN